ncbi:MAG: SDR family oxidoreductase [Maribacter sp.]|nr:SDR family oxidoreductase [Maribacter sp.]
MTEINGKTVWITGASSGIGEAMAYALNSKGCNLIISSRKEKDLLKVQGHCEFPEKVAVVPLDLTNLDVLPNRVETAKEAFGGIDILINNAGISQRSLIVETEFAVYEKLIQVNYLGTVALSRLLLPHFINRKSGQFVTVTSLMGKFGSPYRSGYCAAKHALHGFFDVLRMEHEKDGIAVTLICPGFIQTNVAKNALTADGSAQGTDDQATQNGLPTAVCAQRIIRAIEKRRFEAYIGRKEIMGIYLKRFFPKYLHKFVLKSKVR